MVISSLLAGTVLQTNAVVGCPATACTSSMATMATHTRRTKPHRPTYREDLHLYHNHCQVVVQFGITNKRGNGIFHMV